MKKFWTFFTVVFILGSCTNDKADNTVSIKFNVNAGTNPLQYNTDYLLDTTVIQFTMVRFYISQPVFSSGADMIAFEDSYFLGEAGVNNTFVVGDVGKRTIDGIAFGIGVDSSRNTINGSKAIQAFAYASSHPLSVANNMYWDWNPGYVFLKLEGRIDKNDDGDVIDAAETFSIHTGLDPAYRFVSRTYIFSMQDVPKTIQIDMDIMRFFDGYDLITNSDAHPMDTADVNFPDVVAIQDNANLVFGNYYE